jgi:hypothetical protein
MVGTDAAVVEQQLLDGLFPCPSCDLGLGPWGHARRRPLRLLGGEETWLTPRRGICRPCRATHVLLPESCLLRRRDHVEVIGSAITASAKGAGSLKVAEDLGLDRYTVRGWLRAFRRQVGAIWSHFVRLAHALDPELPAIEPAGSAVADAVETIAVAARAAVQRFGPAPVWEVAARLSGGVLLCNTSRPFPAVP